MWKKSLVFSGSIVGFALVLIGLVAFQARAAEKETLIIGMQDPLASLDPAKAYDVTSLGVTSQLYDTLVRFDEDSAHAKPSLAESWEIGVDGKTWTFHLRKDMTFVSGNPINADAVVYSLTRAIELNKDPAWLLTQFGLNKDSIQKVDDLTITFTLDRSYAPTLFLSCLGFNVASILDAVAVKAHEQQGDWGSAWLEEHSAGSGAFILEKREEGRVALQANPAYRGDKPATKNIVVTHVAEPIEQAIQIEKGGIDVAWDLQPDQIRRLETLPDIQVFETPTFTTIHFVMNVAFEPLTKPEVRNAIRYAIDYDGLVDLVLQGAAVKTQSIFPKGMSGYIPDMPYEYNPEKAKQLLNSAGYPDGVDIELLCLDYAPWVDIAAKIKSDLKNIGIRVKIKQTDISGMVDAYVSRNFQLHLWQWQPDYVDPDSNAKALAHSDKLGDDATIKSVLWFSHYVNAEIARLVEDASLESDESKRDMMYQEIARKIQIDGPFAVLCVSKKPYAIRFEKQDLLGIPSVLRSNFPPIR
ncbi:ABC-type dipeptide transport system, periplasmic component [Candidatus Moduliflexus flocculans]|uniref:ABC-type dipeptide transport system, periplasmic component n=1 Tax=Candidatus Moduliflexus flocculans TaxID=1499966 RepID=A0A081BS85_9BACT|nr:ABC-type dipeptide transport system, periplasmic component [Candidatus Moduliflexus flocculans]